MNKKTILVTGAAGFIGANLCLKLFEKYENIHIIGIDNMNAYYDVNIKKWRLSEILQQELIRAGVLPEDYDFDSHKELVPMQPGDVPVTYADTSALERDFGFKPSTDLRTGLRKFAEWYKEFYKI